jgi:hypothetical protein
MISRTNEDTPVEPFGARELRLARFRAEEIPPDADTGETCPACDGSGHIIEETGLQYKTNICSLCDSAGWTTVSRASDWRSRDAVVVVQSN